MNINCIILTNWSKLDSQNTVASVIPGTSVFDGHKWQITLVYILVHTRRIRAYYFDKKELRPN